jgi:hypothetical protein
MNSENTVEGCPRLYFVNAVVDSLLIGGASLLAFLYFFFFHTGGRSWGVITLAIQLSWFVNWPHFSSTYYRLYGSIRNLRQFPVTALLVPGVILLGAIGSLVWPVGLAPYFMKLYIIWSPYHFAGQTLGITLLYCRRAGLRLRPIERHAITATSFGTFLTLLTRLESSGQGFNLYGIPLPVLGIPTWTCAAAQLVMYGGAFVLGAAVLERRIKGATRWPAIVFLPLLAQYVWFVAGAESAGFLELVPFFHGLQYLLIAWSLHLKETLGRRLVPGTWGLVGSESLRWAILNVLGGVVLFWALPAGATMAGVAQPLGQGILAAAVQLHHFFVDGVIWKLKSPAVSSPLMVNIDELVNPAGGVA